MEQLLRPPPLLLLRLRLRPLLPLLLLLALPLPKRRIEAAFVPRSPPEEIAALEASAAEFGDKVRALKGAKAPKEEVEAAVALLKEVRKVIFFSRS